MNQNLFNRNLKGTKLSNTLSLLSTIELALGSVLAVLTFLVFFILGIVVLVDGIVLSFFLMLLFGILGGGCIFFASFVSSVLLKGFASIVLHNYITALNSDKIAENTRKPL